MYKGELVTLRFKDYDNLVVTSLKDITGVLDSEGLLLKKDGKDLGHVVASLGIDFEEMIQFMLDNNNIVDYNNV